MTYGIRTIAAGAMCLLSAACMQDSPPLAASAEVTTVRVDGTGYPVRLTRNETYFMAVGNEGLVPDGRRGPGIRVGGADDGLQAAHILAAFCAGSADYRTRAVDPATLFGAYGDLYWQDAATTEWVFPMPDCRS